MRGTKLFLRVSLLTVPVKVYPATSDDDTGKFNQLHGSCKARINQQLKCQKCSEIVPAADIVKGYEHAPGQWIVLTKEDIAAIKLDSDATLTVLAFVAGDKVNSVMFEKSYFIGPDKVGADSFSILREAFGDNVAIARMVSAGREVPVAIRAQGNGFVLSKMFKPAEIRSMDMVPGLAEDAAPNAPEMVALAKQLITTMTTESLPQHADRYELELEKVIAAKIAGEAFTPLASTEAVESSNTLEALRASLAAAATWVAPEAAAPIASVTSIAAGRKKPAKAVITDSVKKRKTA